MADVQYEIYCDDLPQITDQNLDREIFTVMVYKINP